MRPWDYTLGAFPQIVPNKPKEQVLLLLLLFKPKGPVFLQTKLTSFVSSGRLK